MSGGLALREQPGAGEAVLWLHGYTMDSRIWEEAWALLPGPRHLGLDLPGHGGSPPAPGLDLPALGRRVAEVARAAAPGSPCGSSLASTSKAAADSAID